MNRFLGPILLITCNLLYAVSHSLVKVLAGVFTPSQLMFFRFIVGPLFLSPFVFLKIKKITVHRPWFIVARVGFGVTAMYFFFLSLKYGHPGKSSLLFQLCIVWTFLIDVFIRKEKPHFFSKVALPLSFVGLYLVLAPFSLVTFGKAEAFAILASFFNTGVILTLKSLRHDHDSFTIVLLSYSLSSFAVVYPSFDATLPHIGMPYLIAIAMGLIGFIGQILMTEGFKYSPAWLCSCMALVGIPFMYLFGILFFNEIVTTTSLLGITLLITSLGTITLKQ